MGFKKAILVLLLLIILTMGAASAADTNTTSDNLAATEDKNLELNENDEVLSIDSTDVISDPGNGSYTPGNGSIITGGTFSDLDTLIQNAGSELNLSENYTYTGGDPTSITIDKQITINGNGITIDGKGTSRAFEINFNNVVLNNINFINCNNINGGAIYWNGAQGTISNCNFTNNTANGNGGSVYINTNNVLIDNCHFINCSATNLGGALLVKRGSDVTNSCFVNCSANSGGAIYLDGHDDIIGCEFINCSATESGGALYCYGEEFLSNEYYITNSTFSDTTSPIGGAIYWSAEMGRIKNSRFKQANLPKSTAIYGNTRVDVTDCAFETNGTETLYDLIRNGNIDNCTLNGRHVKYVNLGVSLSSNIIGTCYIGDTIELTVIIYNDGPETAENTIVSFLIPPSLYVKTYVGYNFNATTGIWNVSKLLEGHYPSLTLTLEAIHGGNITINATITSDEDDLYLNDNIASININIAKYETPLIFNPINATVGENFIIAITTPVDATGTINVNLDGIEYNITIFGGIAILNTTLLSAGTHMLTATYSGDENYLPAMKSTSFTVSSKGNNTFTDLKNLINSTNPGDTIELDDDYTNDGSITADGIEITKAITINGNGHTLDAKGLSRIFNINAANVVLNNITLINGHHDTQGGAIYWNAANGTLYNSIFLNCTSNKGGAIQWTGAKGTVIGCNFENNTADTGGAIYWYYADDGIIVNSSFYNSNACAIDLTSSNNCRVTNCNFVRNIAYQRGGSIHWYGSDNGSVSYCNFIESHDIYGGAVFWHYSNDGSISNCNFEKNTASNGGAIRTYACHILVSNSKFVENSATLTGGAIDADCSVYNCTFINNTADCGGAIEEGGSKCSISDCTFIGNNANSGGTIRSSDCSITNCTFEKNTANYGGAIHGGNRNIINNCTFTDCSSNKKGGAIYLMLSDNIVTNCTFINCSSTEEGGAIELYGENNKVDNSIFIKSKGSSAKAIHVNGNNSTISNSNFEDEKVKSIYELINQGKIINCTLNGNKTIIAKINIINSINEYLNGNFSFQLIDFYTDEPIAGVVLQLMTTGNIRAGFSATTDADGIATFKTKNLYEFSQNTTTFEMKKLEVGNHTVELKTSENVESASTYANLTIIKANINLATVIDGINATVTATNKKNEEAVPEIVLHISYNNQDSYLTTDANGTVKFIANLPCGTHTITVSTNDTKNINYTETNITIDVPYKTFQDLSLLIANASEGSILELSDDYIYGNGTTEGIQITKAITIDGKGHTLDALFKSRIFNIAADGVVLKNIVFNNGRPYDDGGAISCECNNLTIVNCTFDNNAASYFAGAVDCTGDNLTILYSTFTNNEANGDGGAVRSTGDNCMISDCTFISNSAVGDGGAVLTNGENCIISNSKFNNNVAVIYNGGAVRNTGDYCIIRNSTFIGNRASSHYGGAIKSGGANPIISNSVFIDNHALEGGAFFVSVGFYSTVINSSFINNTADDKGGAINFDILGNVTGCTFSGNSDPEIYSNNNTLNINSTFTELKSLIDSANSGDTIDLSGYYYGSGSSISIDKTITLRGNGETVLDAKGLSSILSVSANNVRIENIKFVNGQNSGNWGGAIHWEGDSGVLINSTFVNNVASWGAGIFWWAQDGYMANCTFENNTAERYGGALYVNGEKLRMLNSLFKNNIVTESISSWEGGGAIYTDGNNHLVANSTFIDNKAINSWGGAIKHGSETASYQSNEFYNNTAIRGNSVWESDANNLVNNIFNLNSIDEIASCVEDANLSALFENNIFKVKGIVISKDDYFNETDTGSNESSQNITQSTFTDITNLISNAHAGDTINLEGTYYGTGSIITVNKELTIKGNGETILDAKNLSGILSVSADNVRINNIRFINGKINANGGAINWIGKNGTISNCTFINCSAENGGSVYWNAENGMINTSRFDHSTATQNGGAIYWNANNGEITDSIFTNSYAQNGGAVYVPENRNVEIKSSIFDNNMAEEESGAVYGGTVDDDCTFKNNTYTPLNSTTIISINETAVYTGNDISITTLILSQKGGLVNTGTVEIYINSKLIATIPANTQYIHTTGEIGTYQVLAKFIDDSSYKDSSSTAEFTVIPVDIPEEIETSTAGIFTLEFPDDAEGTLTVFIDGTKYKVYDIIGGILKIDLSDKKGKYNITFEYSGDDNYPAFKKDANITVETNPSITASNAKVIYSAGTTYKITVYKNKGITANNVSVVIKQNNKAFKTIKTNSKGVASFKVTQTPGTYKLKITSLGKTVTKTLTVKHIVTLKTATVKKSAKKLILQATLAKVNKKYLKKKTVTFKFNGKKYKAKTNAKGVAKVTIKSNVLKKLKVGKKLTYQATYLKDTVKKTTKVKK